MAVVSDYQSFKDYLVRFLWKKSDASLIEDLDNLIKQGENAINRDLREELRHNSLTLTATAASYGLPSDYYAMKQVSDGTGTLGEFKYVSPAELRAARLATQCSYWTPIYSLEGTELMFCGPTSAANPNVTDRQLIVDYVRKIPSFIDTDDSWLLEDNLDLLTYSTLKETAAFLREDERVAVWDSKYASIINMMNENSAHEKQRGLYGPMPLSRNASGYTPRNRQNRRGFKLV